MATVPGSSLFCITKDDFLQDVFAKCKQIEAIKGIPFVLSDGFLPVSSGRERCAIIEMKGIRARKVYVLLSAFISNQHVFTEPLRMELECVKNEEYFRPVFVERLYFPGDLEIGLSGRGQYGFPTYISEQQRGGLPLLPQRGDCDYPKASAPDYPQHYLWNRRIAFQVCETVFTVVEIEMDKERELKELRIFVNDDDTAAGIYAISYI